METALSIQNVLDHKSDYNLAIPFVESQQINPYYKIIVSALKVNPDPNASEVFKIGARSTGNGYENLYILAKPALERLANAAAINFAPGSGEPVKIDENTWKASAFAALRLPDGETRTVSGYKVIDLVTEEKKYRIAYEEKAERGISDKKAAQEAAKKYKGHWEGETYFVAEEEKKRYVERSLLDAMAQLRSSAPQKASTGAILRVIRSLICIKSTYTMEELKKPFAVVRASFSPDYNDPMVKQMMLQKCMQSMGNLFGAIASTPQPMTAIPEAIPANTQPLHHMIDFPTMADQMPEDDMFMDEPSVATDSGYEAKETQENTGQASLQEEIRVQDFCCDKCGVVIPEKVWNYSVEKYERPLCYKCQRIIRGETKGKNRS